MRNPLIDFFKDFGRSIRSNYQSDGGTMVRVPMTMAQLDRTVLTLEDAEYFKQTTEVLCDQVDEVQKGLDNIEERAMNLTKYRETCTMGQLKEIQEIISEVNRMRDFYGKVDEDES